MPRRCVLSYFVLFVAYSLSFADVGINKDPYNMQMKASDARYSDFSFNHVKDINCEGQKLQLKFLRMLPTQNFHPMRAPQQKIKIPLDAGQRTIQEDSNIEPLNEIIRKEMEIHGMHYLKVGNNAQNVLQKIFHRIRSYPRVGRAGSQMDDFHHRASFIPRLGRKRSSQS